MAGFFALQKHTQKLTDTHIVTFFNFTTKWQKTTVFCKTLPACYRKQHLEKTKICRKRPKRHRKKEKPSNFVPGTTTCFNANNPVTNNGRLTQNTLLHCVVFPFAKRAGDKPLGEKEKGRAFCTSFLLRPHAQSPVLVTLMGLVRTTGGERSETKRYVISFSRLQNELATSR